MKLKEFASKFTAESNSLKFAIGGEAGSGKTFTAIQIIIAYYKTNNLSKPFLYVDNEDSYKFVKKYLDKAGIESYVKVSSSLKDFKTGLEILRTGEIDFLFVDSLTKIYKSFVESYMQSSKISFMSQLHWIRVIGLWNKNFNDDYQNTKGNVAFTGRGGNTYGKEDDKTNEAGDVIEKGTQVQTGVKLKLPSEAAYEPDLILWMNSLQKQGGSKLKLIHQCQVLKDRTSQLEGKIFENPTGKEFIPYFNFLKGLTVDSPETTEQKDVELIPTGADTEYWKRKEQKDILLEKIKSLFEKFGLSGTGKDIKQLLVLTMENVFLTTSWTEIENSNLDKVNEHYINLNNFFSNMNEETLADKQMFVDYIKNFRLAS